MAEDRWRADHVREFQDMNDRFNQKQRDDFDERAAQARKMVEKIGIIAGSTVAGIFLLIIIACLICCCVPACFLSSQARDRRRQLQGGQGLPPPAYMGQPGGGGQPVYNTAHPSQQQFNQPGTPLNPDTATIASPPPYPTQSGV